MRSETRKLLTKFLAAVSVASLAAGCAQPHNLAQTIQTEELMFNSGDVGKQIAVLAQINLPSQIQTPVPVIISQHGSSRDGMTFVSGRGRTDEFTTRLTKKATEQGFAVIALDAFYGTDLGPSDKRKFPNAYRYAIDLKKQIQNDPRFNMHNVFYSGFSFGAEQMKKAYSAQAKYNDDKGWNAVAALEPGCNVTPQVTKKAFPIMIIKGDESHYQIEPCLFFAKLLKEKGNQVIFETVQGANHFLSSNGKITRGKAVNGCWDNPVIQRNDGTYLFADGTVATRAEVNQRCITDRAGSGKDRRYLDESIDKIIHFFITNTQ